MSTKLKIAAAVAAAVLLSACSSPKHEPMPPGEIYTEHGSHRGLVQRTFLCRRLLSSRGI